MTDLTFLRQFTQGNPDKMKKYIGIFLQTAPGMLDKMKEALNRQDFETIRITAHSLKPQMAYMGIQSQEQAIKDIESYAGNSSQWSKIPFMLNNYDLEIRKALEQLTLEYQKL